MRCFLRMIRMVMAWSHFMSSWLHCLRRKLFSQRHLPVLNRSVSDCTCLICCMPAHSHYDDEHVRPAPDLRLSCVFLFICACLLIWMLFDVLACTEFVEFLILACDISLDCWQFLMVHAFGKSCVPGYHLPGSIGIQTAFKYLTIRWFKYDPILVSILNCMLLIGQICKISVGHDLPYLFCSIL